MVSFVLTVPRIQKKVPKSTKQAQVPSDKMLKDAAKVPADLANLPAEVTLEIMRHLGPANSTCLGLTCKKLYQLHRVTFGSVNLGQMMDYRTDQVNTCVDLGFILQTGWLPCDLAYNFGTKKFMAGSNRRKAMLKRPAREGLLIDV